MDELSQKNTVTIFETLKDILPGLPATYDRIFRSITPKDRSACANILRWVTFAIRSLSLKELATAMGMEPTLEASVEDRIRG